MTSPAALVLAALAASAIPALVLPGPPIAPAQACRAVTPAALQAQRLDVERVLQPVEADHAAKLAALEQSPATPQAEAELEAVLAGYERRKRPALEPLAGAGNAEAMMRLAAEVRDSDSREDAARWLALVTCASGVGHPAAHDELVRWHWHQRGDGSVDQVQHNRAVALDFARRAAAAGHTGSLARVATYIAGDVHQYPANLPLARRLMELCARTDDSACQENLAGGGAYDYGQTAVQRHLWLGRLAMRQPDRFAARRDAVWIALSPQDRRAAKRLEAEWRPVTWAELGEPWRDLRADILRHGATSAGVLPNCVTTTPWCRGQ